MNMKCHTHQYQQMMSVGLLLLAGATGSAWAVNHDLSVPCWRDETGATRQYWDFESDANPINPTSRVNPAGTASASMVPSGVGTGYTTNSCLKGLGGCGPAVYAVLPLSEDPCDGASPYLSNLGRLPVDGDCVPTGVYSSPPAAGTAYGFWNIGTGKTVLTIPNNGAPVGTTRYFSIQGTYLVDTGIAGYPSTYGVTNGAGVGNTTTGTKTRTLAEQPLDANGELQSGTWNNEQLVMSVAADTSAGSDTLTILGTAKYVLEGLIVETLDRAAVADTLNAVTNTVTNIPFATLLANDQGATNIVGTGTAVNGSVSLPGGGIVRFTPTPQFSGTASFWYTNRDCASLTNLAAQVTVNVTSGTTSSNFVGKVSLTRNAGTNVVLAADGIPGNQYVLQRSCTSLTNWMDMATNTASGGGLVQFTNAPGACNPAFYRIRSK
jgi:hypothetical protein